MQAFGVNQMAVNGISFLEKQVVKTLFKKMKNGGLRVRYWDGEEAVYGDTLPQVTLIFNRPPTTLLHFDDPAMAFGEAYMDGVWDYEGNFENLLLLLKNPSVFDQKGKGMTRALNLVAGLTDRIQAKQNIEHHYDLGNNFFSLWLDKTMSYSCAYFRHLDDTLEQAQLQKIDYILKKLNLKPGEKLLDIGSGWGWLIIKAAQMYQVKAMGITLSEEQYRKTQERIKELGLEGQVSVKLMNYMDMDAVRYQFDKIVSVGMFEHVGKENIPLYLDKVNELLAPGGLSLLHCITSLEENQKNSWIKKYIFPGGYIPSVREIFQQFPERDFHLLHAESLRLHYAMTLDYWYAGFTEHAEEIQERFGERFFRMWSLYLNGCAAAFRTTGLDIHQILFSKGLNNQLPLTYAHLYQ